MMITPFLFIIRSSAQKDKCQSEKVKNKEENALLFTQQKNTCCFAV